MADLTTYTQVEAELAATAAYDANGSVTEATRRLAALRRKLDFAEQSDENGRAYRFNHEIIREEITEIKAFVRENQSLSEQARIANPSVTHASFAGTGQYSGGGSSFHNGGQS